MSTSVKITVLVDTESFDENLAKEHGFSAWIDAGDRHILFDTGQIGGMLSNAQRLGIDLKQADTLVLSHGHFDHTGQIPQFLEQNDKAQIYCCYNLDITRYSCKIGTAPRSIGMPEASRQALASISPSRIHEVNTPRYLTPHIGITGPVPRTSRFEDTGGPFFLDDHRGVDYLIEDDQSMWFETDKGLLILLGCCHAGLVNTVEYIKQISGIDKVHGIIGGMHLVNADETRLQYTFDNMKRWKPDILIPCHCTGATPVARMIEAIGSDIVKWGCSGFTVEA